MSQHFQPLPMTRRGLLKSAGAGFGYLALAGLLGGSNAMGADATSVANPLAPKQPHFKPRAKKVIFLFMEGAMSSLDTFEYKPVLQASEGKSAPGGGTLNASKFQFKQYGKTGTWFSELLPNIATHADELIVDPSQHGCLATLRFRNRKPGSTWLRGHQSNPELRGSGELRERFPARLLSGHADQR